MTTFGRDFHLGRTEAMASSSILDIAMGDLTGSECGVEEYGVAVVDNGIVLAVDEEDRRTVVWHMPFQRERVAQLTVAHTALAKQRPSRALMHRRMRHRDDRIDGHDEGGTVGFFKQLRRRHHEVPAGRKAHRAQLFRIHTVFAAVVPHISQALPEVVLRIRIAVATEDIAETEEECRDVSRTVTQDEGRNTILLKPASHLMTFRLHVVPEIAAARTDHNTYISFAFCQIRRHLHPFFHACPLPDIHLSGKQLLKGAEKKQDEKAHHKSRDFNFCDRGNRNYRGYRNYRDYPPILFTRWFTPSIASHVLMAVSGTPQKPWRLQHWPERKRFRIFVTTGSCESAMLLQSFEKP